MVKLFIDTLIVGVTAKFLEKSWPNEMELAQNGHFYGLCVTWTNSRQKLAMTVKVLHCQIPNS